MNQDNPTTDVLDQDNMGRPKLSTGLNVLTILTFIGCALQICSALYSFVAAQSNYDTKDQIIEKMNSGNMPAWAKSMMGDPDNFIAMITKSYENRVPIVLMSSLAVILSFIGALQMRKLKKQGFLIYVVGELLPFLSLFLFIGSFALTGIAFYIGFGIVLLFILLYAMQRKYLIR